MMILAGEAIGKWKLLNDKTLAGTEMFGVPNSLRLPFRSQPKTGKLYQTFCSTFLEFLKAFLSFWVNRLQISVTRKINIVGFVESQYRRRVLPCMVCQEIL